MLAPSQEWCFMCSLAPPSFLLSSFLLPPSSSLFGTVSVQVSSFVKWQCFINQGFPKVYLWGSCFFQYRRIAFRAQNKVIDNVTKSLGHLLPKHLNQRTASKHMLKIIREILTTPPMCCGRQQPAWLGCSIFYAKFYIVRDDPQPTPGIEDGDSPYRPNHPLESLV